MPVAAVMIEIVLSGTCNNRTYTADRKVGRRNHQLFCSVTYDVKNEICKAHLILYAGQQIMIVLQAKFF
jgi:hypothetical protein